MMCALRKITFPENNQNTEDKRNMKRTIQIITTASAASLMAFTALAQESSSPKTGGTEITQERSARMMRAERLGRADKASDLIGMDIKNYQGEKLGKVNDLAVDMESGRLVQVILSSGGVLGIGDTLYAVPPGALHHDVANKVIHLDANKEKLATSPKFEMSKWAECCDSNHVTQVYSYYGKEPYFKFTHRGDVPKAESTLNRDKVRGEFRTVNEYEAHKSWSHLGLVQKASKLMGTSVMNRQDEKLGKVENLMVDLAGGRLVAVIVSSGGFLGLGNALSAVPPAALHFSAEKDVLHLDVTKESLTSAPHFKADQWPDISQPVYADGVYRAYKVEPYFSTNAMSDADNTARNVRDRNNRTLTPLDQGNNKADVNTTAQIRKGILAREGMSVNAKNVKIITVDGRVTLRGPVNSAEEKRLLGVIATDIVQVENVDNQLEVK